MPHVVAVVPEVLQMSPKCCRCPMCVANVPYAVLQMSQECCRCPRICYATKALDEIERKFTRRLLMVTLFYLGAKLLQEYLKHEKNLLLKYHKKLVSAGVAIVP